MFSIKRNEEMAPRGFEDTAGNSSSVSQKRDQEMEKETTEMKPKPRILEIKNTHSGHWLDPYNCIS